MSYPPGLAQDRPRNDLSPLLYPHGLLVITRRHVFYLSGFDPRGPSFYHELYKAESQKQAVLSGGCITVGQRVSLTNHVARWLITASVHGSEVVTTYDFMRWDEFIRSHWIRNEASLLFRTLSTVSLFLRTGLLLNAWRVAWKPTLLFIYPAVLLAMTLAMGFISSVVIYLLLNEEFNMLVSVSSGLAVFVCIVMSGRFVSSKTSAYWILRLCNFCGVYGQGGLPSVDERMAEFARFAAEEIRKGEAGEYLFVGHSMGAVMATSILSRLVREHESLSGKRVALLTIGQCIPLVSFLPQATRYRRELDDVANAAEIAWIDFSTHADPVCFALVDPVVASGLPVPRVGTGRPKLLDTKFSQLIEEDRYRKIKYDGKRMHFQYLMACDYIGDYDYFAITAGELTLNERFGCMA